jgi:hypothetical protein
MKGHRQVIAIAAAFALFAVGCKGVDLAAMKTKAEGLVAKYAPELDKGLSKVTELITRKDALPADLPVVGALTDKLKGQRENIEKLQGMLKGLPGQLGTAVKDGKGQEDIDKMLTEADANAGKELEAVKKGLAEAETEVATAENDAKVLAAKTAASKLPETVGGPFSVQATKLEELAMKARAIAPETAGAAELVKGLEELRAEANKARATLDGTGAKVEAAGADAAAIQAAVDATTAEVTAVTKKLEETLPAHTEKLNAVLAAVPPAAPAEPEQK